VGADRRPLVPLTVTTPLWPGELSGLGPQVIMFNVLPLVLLGAAVVAARESVLFPQSAALAEK
jgi:hypothetical protein